MCSPKMTMAPPRRVYVCSHRSSRPSVSYLFPSARPRTRHGFAGAYSDLVSGEVLHDLALPGWRECQPLEQEVQRVAERRIEDIKAAHGGFPGIEPRLYGRKRIPHDFRDGIQAIALGFLAQIQEAGQIGLQGVYAILLCSLLPAFAHCHATILPVALSSSSP